MVGTKFLLFLLPAFLFSCKNTVPGENVQDIRYGPAQRFELSGDTWTGTWADDGNIYSTADDFYNDSVTSNLALFRLKGDDPMNLEIELINPMQEYGRISQLDADSLAWKASGLTCVDGVLYMFVSRHNYPWLYDPAPDNNRQTAQDGSIIKSSDYGKTWSRSAKENTNNPMFPGKRFAAGFFIEYGRDIQNMDDHSDKYVYAVANDGYWNNGNDMILGRVLKSKLPDLNARDWEFYSGNGKIANEKDWIKDMHKAVPVLTDSAHVGMSAVTYLPKQKRYILGQWYFPLGGFCGNTSVWAFRQAPAPWGPWETVSCDTFSAGGFYNPCILSKFIKEDGSSSYISVAGDCHQQPEYYKLFMIPVDFLMKDDTMK
ncbi:MAG: DUF4185 domain-containing protein [Bacteroidales bacterium]|nr:DUF4185 domain-containing protein [Bacteroidales bacterium]